MQILGRWLLTWGQEDIDVQDDLDRRVDAVLERVNAVVARSQNLPDPPLAEWEDDES